MKVEEDVASSSERRRNFRSPRGRRKHAHSYAHGPLPRMLMGYLTGPAEEEEERRTAS